MRPAPTGYAVGDEWVTAPWPDQHAVAPMPPPPSRSGKRQPVHAPPQAPPDGPGPPPPVLELHHELTRHLETLARAHAAFVAHQGEVHERFLALRRRGLDVLALASAAAPVPATTLAEPATTVAGPPAFTREQLEAHSSGRISDVFGPAYARQDGKGRQVRLPKPPLLLIDRCTAIDADPADPGRGRIRTETDVRPDSWFVRDGRVPTAITTECGQSDMFLVSYLGADLAGDDERAYRLLGCTLTFRGDLPAVGDTVEYELEVDGFDRHEGMRVFSFHGACRIAGETRIEVHEARAGFFTESDLAASHGVRWSPEEASTRLVPTSEARLDPPAVTCTRSSFGRRELVAFSQGRAHVCFGPGWEPAAAHTRSPAIAGGELLFLDAVTDFDPRGGPWGRGYVKAEATLDGDEWFFPLHFEGDPCMPGNFMFEGCVQAMSVYLAAMGFTLGRDGWRFQPVTGEAFRLDWRAQVTPATRHLEYELFVEEVVAGPVPTVHGALLLTADGVKAFCIPRFGLQLVPDWPLTSRPELLTGHEDRARCASYEMVRQSTGQLERFVFDHDALLASAWGRPSDAFGPMYEPFDGARRVARFPAPPYMFATRVTSVSADTVNHMRPGTAAELEYEVPDDAWYFDDNGCDSMPLCVLMEVALQAGGWLSWAMGSALTFDRELLFRNLDGTATLHEEVRRDTGTLRTSVRCTDVSTSGGMIIQSFDVECFAGERLVLEVRSVFGFFPPEAFEDQPGLASTDADRAALAEGPEVSVDLAMRPRRYCDSSTAHLAGPGLLMVDRVTGNRPAGGKAGLGRLRAEKDVDASEWFFKAHFFGDPVQPGSLGIEAMAQLLQFHMLDRGMHEGIERPRFQALETGRPLSWKYRGQVLPTDRLVTTVLDVVEAGTDDHGPYAVADATMWVDGKRIYEATNLGMRIVADAGPPGPTGDAEEILDPDVDTWLQDHRPTWARPALPLTSMIDKMASAAGAAAGTGVVAGLRDVRVTRWLDFPGPRRIRTEVEGDRVTLLADDPDSPGPGGPFTTIATGRVEIAGTYDRPPPALDPLDPGSAPEVPLPYEDGEVFHGPAFRYLTSLRLGPDGASCALDPEAGSVPVGLLHPGLLDGVLQSIPGDRLDLWAPEAADRVGYPSLVTELAVHGPAPRAGTVRGEVRFDGWVAKPDFPAFVVHVIEPDGTLWCRFRLVMACFPKGPIVAAPPRERRRFLAQGEYVEGLRRSRRDPDGTTRLTADEVDAADWMPGTVEHLYRTRDVAEIALKEHLAAEEHLHPAVLPDALPLTRHRLRVTSEDGEVAVRTEAPATHDLTAVASYWRDAVGTPPGWLGEDVLGGLIDRYVDRVVLTDPDAMAQLRGSPAIYVANHQVQVESLLAGNLIPGITGLAVTTMANAKHRRSWVGELSSLLAAYPGYRRSRVVVHFDPSQPESMLSIVEDLEAMLASGSSSFLVHVAGTRSRSCRETVTRMSSLFVDLAVRTGVPVVPVRFTGGLPVEPAEDKLELPVGHGAQDHWFGSPIMPAELDAMPYAQRSAHVLAAINGLGPPAHLESPAPPDPAFGAAVAARRATTGVGEVNATIAETLARLDSPGPDTEAFLGAETARRVVVGDDPHGHWLAGAVRYLLGDGVEVVVR